MRFCVRLVKKTGIGLALTLGAFAFAWAQAPEGNCPPPLMPPDQLTAYWNKATPKNAGFLWRMTKNGQTSWLYGTIHVNAIEFALPGPQIVSALRNSDVFVPEINFLDPGSLAPPVPPSSNAAFTPSKAQLDRLRTAYLKECLQDVPSNLPPILLIVPPLMAQAQRLGLWPMLSPDMLLTQVAAKLGRPISPLETVTDQLASLAPASTAQASEQLEAALKSIESSEARNQLLQLSKAWQSGDWAGIVSAEKAMQDQEPEFAKRLLDQRNLRMAQKIDAMHSEGKRVFVAVGSLHMAGKSALVQLMMDKGYTVTPITLKN